MDPAITALGTLGAATATAGIGYATARWRASGRIATTDANTLWEKLIDQLARRDSRIEGLEASLGKLTGELWAKEQHIARLEQQIETLAEELGRKDQRIAVLESQKNQLEARVSELETELRKRLEAAKAASHLVEG